MPNPSKSFQLPQRSDKAHELSELITTMAGSNVLDRIDTITTRLESKIDAVNTKYTVLIWAIGFAGLVISAAIIFSG